jgi:hypothetical protein
MRDGESPSYEALYHQLVRLRQQMPAPSTLSRSDGRLWLARVVALIEATGFTAELFDIRAHVKNLVAPAFAHMLEDVRAPLSVAMTIDIAIAKLELRLPAEAQGRFIPTGGVFDGFQAVAKAVALAKSDVFFVDPWADGTLIADYGSLVPEHVQIRVLDDAFKPQPSLKPAADRWIAQYQQARPLQVRRAPARALHDRLIVVDETVAWVVGQSLKDLAKRSPSYLQKMDQEAAALKIAAYKDIWDRSTPPV